MLKNYLKVAFKVFLRRKFFTFISLFGISLTLVVLVVAVAFLDHVFGPQVPETNSDRTLSIYMVKTSSTRGGRSTGPAAYPFHDRYVRTLPSAEKVTVHSIFLPVISYRNGLEIKSWMKNTDGEFWEIYHFNFLEGAPYTRADEKNANFVAVINDTTRRRFFGNQPAVGKMLELDGQNFRIVGVVADVPMLRFTPFADVWVPISTRKSDEYKREFHNGMFLSTVMARTRSGLPAIRQDFQSMLGRIDFPEPEKANHMEGEPKTLFEAVSDEFFSGHLAVGLLVAMSLFLLLPTINLVNINVSRIRERASEIGVRKAFGASSWTLVGQFVIENVVLTLIGGLVSFAGSHAILKMINASDLIPYTQLTVNYRIFFYGLVITLFFGVFSGVYPAWKMSRLHPVEALRGRTL
jgi:putative ABC transport system permease protein